MPSPFFSVVLATYNGRRFLSECIESVLAQTWRDFEFIIVDDGSTDESHVLIDHFARAHPDLIQALRLEENSGQGAAFNAGIARARGILVAFLDSDDVWFPEKLARVAVTFGDPAEIALHQHQMKIMRDTVLTRTLVRPTLVVGDVFADAMRTRQLPIFVPTTGLTFAARVLRQIGPIPVTFRICADGFLTRASIAFGQVSGAAECCAAYRVHGGNETFENPKWDNPRYVREQLVPELNAFYRRHAVPFAFPEAPPPAAPANATIQAQESLGLLRLKSGDRVLLVRSAPAPRVKVVLAGLFAACGEIQIDLLVQPGFEAEFADPRVRPLRIEPGMMSPRSIPPETRAILGAQRYTHAIAVYNDPDGSRYGNLFSSLFSLPLTCPLVGVTSDLIVQEIRRPGLNVLKLQPGERVLLVRTSPVSRMWSVVAALFQAQPQLVVDLLVQPGLEPDFTDPRINLMKISEGPMHPAMIPEDVRATLRQRDYAAVVLAYNEPDGRNYQNVHATVASLPVTTRRVGVGSGGALYPLLERPGGAAPVVTVHEDVWSRARDCHRGRRAFVIGNGPSLQMADLDRLRGEITFASNKIFLAFDQVAWRPTYYCVCDEMVAENNAARIRAVEARMFLPWAYRKFYCAGPNTVWYEEKFENKFATQLSAGELERANLHFSRDVGQGVHSGYTVIYNQLQIAWHMGIREVYLIGIDFSFQVPTARKVDTRFQSADYRNALVSEGERNHFHPDYRPAGETWTMPRLDVMACGYRTARDVFVAAGGSVVNASRKSALTVLPREDLDVVLARSA